MEINLITAPGNKVTPEVAGNLITYPEKVSAVYAQSLLAAWSALLAHTS